MGDMKATLNSNRILIVLLALVSWSLMSCGASKVPSSGSSDFPSRSPVDSNDPNEGLLAECNELRDTDLGIAAQLATYYNPNTGVVVNDNISMHIEKLPSVIYSNTNHYLQIFKWSEDTPGQRITHPNPVQIFFVQRGTGTWINKNEPVTTISKNIIQNTIVKYKLGDSGTNENNFFDNYHIVLTGLDLIYDAILIAFYDATKGTASYGWVEALLPAFAADPNIYAKSHPAIGLQRLHPMYSRRSSGMTEEDFRAETDVFCEAFF